MLPREYRCTSVTETKSFAADLANSLPTGIVIALIGDLGSVKPPSLKVLLRALE